VHGLAAMSRASLQPVRGQVSVHLATQQQCMASMGIPRLGCSHCKDLGCQQQQSSRCHCNLLAAAAAVGFVAVLLHR
jgi:hypothetical protein